ncbi:hypothetical protein, partial [Collimonas sp.]|uniref:hypothetical protein n=1 Tax=Collimonas sp. TaxID=1963772 RepID=UPI002C62A555
SLKLRSQISLNHSLLLRLFRVVLNGRRTIAIPPIPRKYFYANSLKYFDLFDLALIPGIPRR